MIKRVAAWVALAVVVWLVVHYSSAWRSPWAVVSSPVLLQLPKASNGCGDACK